MKTGLVWLANAFGARRAAEVAGAYRNTFAGDDGRRVLNDLARYCRFGTTSFVPGDPYQTAFNEGARDAFLHVIELAGLGANDVAELLAVQSTSTEQEPS
ncbi:MAG TPA: hypothetical protein VL966_06920 [Alphaproteobacteria bacterium]|jgi:hypothetical protein|nr:hypothetical protein [Alphaproteobacteria bacterium]